MFSVTHFGRMLTDGVRHPAHLEALRRIIRPGSIVLDIGTGSGVYALIAARLGAEHVYAIDPNPCVQLARQHVIDNGLQDRVTVICGISTELELPRPADVILSDLRDTMPFNGKHFSSMLDARRRLVAPGGIVTPQRDVVMMGLVEAPGLRADVVGPWGEPVDGLDFSAALEFEANMMRFGKVKAEMLLAEPFPFSVLDYESGEDLERPHTLDVTVKAARSGTAHALGLWFDATIIDDIGYTTGPSAPPTVYGNAYLPFRDPIELTEGDEVRVQARTSLEGDWEWQWMVSSGEQRCSPWRQSTIRSRLVTDEQLATIRGAR